jgi:hypothetical protein
MRVIGICICFLTFYFCFGLLHCGWERSGNWFEYRHVTQNKYCSVCFYPFQLFRLLQAVLHRVTEGREMFLLNAGFRLTQVSLCVAADRACPHTDEVCLADRVQLPWGRNVTLFVLTSQRPEVSVLFDRTMQSSSVHLAGVTRTAARRHRLHVTSPGMFPCLLGDLPSYRRAFPSFAKERNCNNKRSVYRRMSAWYKKIIVTCKKRKRKGETRTERRK